MVLDRLFSDALLFVWLYIVLESVSHSQPSYQPEQSHRYTKQDVSQQPQTSPAANSHSIQVEHFACRRRRAGQMSMACLPQSSGAGSVNVNVPVSQFCAGSRNQTRSLDGGTMSRRGGVGVNRALTGAWCQQGDQVVPHARANRSHIALVARELSFRVLAQ